MNGHYRGYSNFLESDVDWIGRVPAHWAPLKFKRVLSEKKHTSNPALPAGSISFGRVVYKNSETLAEATKASYQEILPDEFLVNPLNLNFDLKSLRTALSAIAVVVSTGYIVLRGSRELNKRFTRWLLQEFDVAHMKTLGAGVRQTINFTDIGNSMFFAPPCEEQTQIAKFLDFETAKTDALIEKQQRLIALLKEKRQSVISHAVTRGLNPDAPLRDSGVEWLGEVPAHWVVCRVKQATSFITSGPRGWSDLISEEGSDVFLQSGDLNDKLGLRLETAKRITPPRNAEGVRTKMQDGDVVVCITGANTGRVAVANRLSETVFVNQHLSLLRPVTERIHPLFLATILASSSVRSYFAVKQYGLKEGLSLTNVAEAPLCLPPASEQQAIVAHVTAIGDKMDRLEVIAADQVAVLQERRTALISAAVTGKIDVRGWMAPNLEEEVEVA